MTQMLSPMLRLFREGAQSYQPESDVPGAERLAPETGDPRASLENLRSILAAGLMIRDILASPSGVLVLFSTGEQYYAPGLRVGTDGPATEALAQIAAEARFGGYERLLRHYRAMPPDYDGQLLPLIPKPAP